MVNRQMYRQETKKTDKHADILFYYYIILDSREISVDCDIMIILIAYPFFPSPLQKPSTICILVQEQV